jgi:hypothetical protein
VVGEFGCFGGGDAFVILAGGLQGAQRVVPIGFEAVGDEPVVGVDGQVAAAGEVGAVASAFDGLPAQRVGLGGAGFQFGLHGQGDLERERGEGVEQQAGRGVIDDCAGDGLAAGRAVLDAAVLAMVVGDLGAAAGVVAHGHPASPAPADRQALQQPIRRRSHSSREGLAEIRVDGTSIVESNDAGGSVVSIFALVDVERYSLRFGGNAPIKL